jgi:O-Antigen ligase
MMTAAQRQMIPLAVAAAYLAIALPEGGAAIGLIAAVAILLWWAAIVGIVARLWPDRVVPGAAVAAGACLAGLGALTALSMIWADDAGRAFTEVVRIAAYLGLFTLVVVASSRTGARPWLAGLAIGVVLVAALALASAFDPDLFGGGDRDVVRGLGGSGLLSFPLGYWNGLGACLAVGAVLLAWLGAASATRLGRTAAIAALPAVVMALYLTESRGAAVAAVGGVLVLLALGPARAPLLAGLALGGAGAGTLIVLAESRPALLDALETTTAEREGAEMAIATAVCVLAVGLARYLADSRLAWLSLPRVSPRVGIGALVVLALAALVLLDPGRRVEEFVDSLQGVGVSGRDQFWEAALDAFTSDPLIGVGAGNYELWWNTHAALAVPIKDAHSLYLEALAELGLGGLALVLGFLVATALAARARLASSFRPEVVAGLAVVTVVCVTAALDWTWELPAAFAPAIVAAALVTGPATLTGEATDRDQGQFGLGVATLVLAWAAIWVAAVLLVSDVKLEDSREAAARNQLDAAAQDARDAATVQPWSPDPRLQLAQVEQLRGDVAAAREEIAEAIERAPVDWRAWLVAAEIEAQAGDGQAARDAFERAQALSPLQLPSPLDSE